MDLRLKRRRARVAAKHTFSFIGAALFLWLSPVQTNASQMGADYMLPAEAKGGFITSVSSIESAGSAAKQSATVTYQAMDGSSHQLVQHHGRLVSVLLPQSFNDGPFFTADHIEELIDQLDILYTLYADILQSEPSGDGLLTVAFVPNTCGTGCGMVGAKGFEVRSEKRNYESIIKALNNGSMDRVLLHEMAHNFDIYSSYLHYLPDHAHAWTEIFEFFAPYRYSRLSVNGMTADELYNSPMNSVWKEYITDQQASWELCVRDNSCTDMGISANQIWAMLYYRIEAMHGAEAILDSFEFLKAYAQSNAPPTSNESKEGLRLLSLAVGARDNISCYMSALKWPINSSTRKKMESRFGRSDKLCADLDMDGFSTINGDCDDTNSLINISRPEIIGNGADDDCDELIDEVDWIEANEGSGADNFNAVVKTALPFDVHGSSAVIEDRDTFSFPVSASGQAYVTFCASEGFKGWVAALQPDGSFLNASNWFSYQSKVGCTSNSFDFGDFETGGLVVISDSASGDYSLTVSASAQATPDLSQLVQVTSRPEDGQTLSVSDANGLLTDMGADAIEIWISEIGIRASVPFNGGGEFKLNSSTAPGLLDGQAYHARIRPMANGLPLANFSAGHLFNYDPLAKQAPAIDHQYSGAWFDPSHDGEGFIIEVLEDQKAIVYWFTYQFDGSQRWMLGVGDVKDNRIEIADLLDTRGGRFGKNFNPDDVVLEKVGSMTLSFLDCSTALVNYSVDNIGGQQTHSRLTQVFGHKAKN